MKAELLTQLLLDELSTLGMGEKCAQAIQIPAVIYLYGELGAGKTTFARGFLRGLGYEGHVRSPTYTLVEPYEMGHYTLYHFDLYRLQDPHELEYMGIKDYFHATAICLIEWPENGKGELPNADVDCYFQLYESGRLFKMVAHSAAGGRILQGLVDAN